LLIPFTSFVGKQEFCFSDDIFHPIPCQVVPPDGKDDRRLRFGTSGTGRNLFSEVWSAEHHVFAAEGRRQLVKQSQDGVTVTQQPEQRGPVNIGCPRQAPVTVLQDHPVDVLIVESSEDDSTSGTKMGSSYWEQWLVSCTEPSRPDLVLVCADSEELVKDGGFHSKMW